MVRFDLAVPTDVRFGAGRVSEVPQALVELGANRVMVITGRTTSRADAIRSSLNEAGISTLVFGVAAEPSIERVRAAVALLAEAGCDAVLGFGGGSALDVAKAAAVLATSGSDPMDHLEVIGAGRPIERAGLPCVAVPTTAGTGSEVTRNAVLSGGGVKASLRSPLLLPKVALVDPDQLVGVPKPTIAASGMDALSQLIEPLLSQRANPFTDALAGMGSAAPPDHWVARTRREWTTPAYARTLRLPACSAACAWPIQGWAPSTGSPQQPAPDSLRRMARSARLFWPRPWTSTCGPCVSELPAIQPCGAWTRWRLY